MSTHGTARSLFPLPLPPSLSHRAYRQLAVIGRPSHGHDLGHLDAIAFSRCWLRDGIQVSELHFFLWRPSPVTAHGNETVRLLLYRPGLVHASLSASLPFLFLLRLFSTSLERRCASALPGFFLFFTVWSAWDQHCCEHGRNSGTCQCL